MPPHERIRVLAPEVAARIAAGEVIERPASAVKELVENALDAGASTIDVEIEGGGVERLRVRDDGGGIPPEQVADAFKRHSTSKLSSEHDLYTIRSLGFRGEALAAIAAAADVDLTTRPPREHAAAVARYRAGLPGAAGSAASAPGTTVEVRELFARLPARRRFLHSARAEARAVAQVVTDYALARPDVGFRLSVDGRSALTTPGSGAPADAFAAVYGGEVAEALLPAAADRTEAPTASPDAASDVLPSCTVAGLAGPPSLHRGSRRYIHLVANGRTIGSRSLVHAIEEAYRGLMPAGRHPVALLRIEVPPAQVDVNVHPRKAEVRFRHDRLVYATVAQSIRTALAGAPAPASPLPVALSPGEPGAVWPAPHAEQSPVDQRRGRDALAAARPSSALRVPAPGAPSGVEGARGPWGSSVDGAGVLGGDEAVGGRVALPLRERLPALRPLGQFDRLYLVAEGPDGLYLVDQHAAHERVLYERAQEASARGRTERQPLLEPLVVALAPAQAALAATVAEDLATLGFECDEVDGGAVLLRAVPAALARRDPARALADYLDALEAEERLTGPDRALATLACRAAVMAGDRLAPEEQRALLRDLEAAATPQSCPHGRPTVVHLSRDALDRSFHRPRAAAPPG